MRALEKEAGKYKLQLNIRKTEIVRLPQPVTDSWVIELGQHLPMVEEISTFDAFRYLDYAVSLSKRYQGGSVLKYAASLISGKKYSFADAPSLLNYLLALAFHSPVLLPVLSKLMDCSYLEFDGAKFDLYNTSEKLEKIVQENARLGRSDGMCWGLYYLGHVVATISEETAKAVIESEDALAILTLYWASELHHKLVIDFCESLDKSEIYLLDRYWMLLYQLFIDNEIEEPYGDGVFSLLSKHGVKFVLPNTPPIREVLSVEVQVNGEGEQT